MADQGTEGLLSPFLRSRRVQVALPHLRGRILDFGCGSGHLARHLPPDQYIGCDIDAQCLDAAKVLFPHHCFLHPEDLPDHEKFDTVVSLAVIEHFESPQEFLRMLASRLNNLPSSRIVCTTPSPWIEQLHYIGSRLGLFSHHANEEHHSLLDEKAIRLACGSAGISIISYKTFLYGANQIFIASK